MDDDSTIATGLSVSPQQEFDRLCESCGYNLRGLTENRCPECGREFDPTRLPLARIPWLQREEIGLLSAYLGTVFEVLFHPRKFCGEFRRASRIPVIAGEQFRVMNIRIAVASVTVAPLLVAVCIAFLRDSPGRVELEGLVVFSVLLTGVGIFVYIFCRMAMVLPASTAFTFRAAGLALILDYASAPLIFSPFWSLGMALRPLSRSFTAANLIGAVCAVVGLGVAGLVWIEQVILVSLLERFEWSRIIYFAIRLTVHWIFSAIIAAIVAFVVFIIMGIVAALAFSR